MESYEPVYEAAEDSELLQKYVRKYAFGRVLDLGTGSGIQAIEASKKKKVKSVLAADISDLAVENFRKITKKEKRKKIKVKKSDLFSKIKGKFETIVFNPPYLPEDKGVQDKALYGGKKGYELLEKFLGKVNNHLSEEGIVLIVFSSLTGQKKIDEMIEKNLLEFRELERMHIFFEDLIAYSIRKSAGLKELDKKKVKEIKYLAKGRRGLVFTGAYKSRKIAVKVKRRGSEAARRIKNEVKYLRLLNKKKIGPGLLFYGKDYLAEELVKGEFILDWIKGKKEQRVKEMLVSVLKQCFEMDKLKSNKEEMHHPLKHIILGKEGKPKLIDFERCYKTNKPHNVTQFGVFLMRYGLVGKGIINRLRDYKKEMSKKNFDKILELVNRS